MNSQRYICVALAAVFVAAYASDIPPALESEVDLQATWAEAHAEVLVQQKAGKDASACEKVADDAEDEVRDSCKAAQSMVNKLPSGQHCCKKGASLVTKATQNLKNARRASNTCETELKKLRNTRVTFRNVKYRELRDGQCHSSFFSGRSYRNTKEAVERKQGQCNKRKGEIEGARKALELAKMSRDDLRSRCRTNTRNNQNSMFNRAVGLCNSSKNKKTWARAHHMKCVLKKSTLAGCRVGKLPQLSKPRLNFSMCKDQKEGSRGLLKVGDTVALWNPTWKRFMRMNGGRYLDKSPNDSNSRNMRVPHNWYWERFKVVDGGMGEIALWNKAHKRFIRMQPGNGHPRMDRSGVRNDGSLPDNWSWERFKVVRLKKKACRLNNNWQTVLDNANTRGTSAWGGIHKVRAQGYQQYYDSPTKQWVVRIKWPEVYLKGANYNKYNGWYAMHSGCSNHNGVAGCQSICRALFFRRGQLQLNRYKNPCGNGYPSNSPAKKMIYKHGNQGAYSYKQSTTHNWIPYGDAHAAGKNPMKECRCVGTTTLMNYFKGFSALKTNC